MMSSSTVSVEANAGAVAAPAGSPSRGRYVAQILLIATLYFLTARFGLWLAAIAYKNVTTVWPPTGIALAALIVLGPRLWPGVAVGAFLANATTGLPVPVAAAIAAGNTIEALAGAYLLRRSGFDAALARIGDVVRLVALAAIGATAVSATIGVASLWLGGFVGPADVLQAWRTWWIGDMLGALLVVPLILTFRRAWPMAVPPGKLVEALGLAVAIGLVGAYVFFRHEGMTAAAYPEAYFVFPLLIWAATRFGPRGAAAASLLVSVLAIWGTYWGRGPFARDDLNDSLSFLQTFTALQTVTVLLLAAAVAEGRRAEEHRVQLEALREVDALKDQFMGILSHELRTPLNAITGYGSMLRDREAGPLTDEQVHCVDRMLRGTDTLLTLVDDLLDLTRIRAGRFTLALAPTDFREVVEVAGDALLALAARKRLRLVTEVAPDLPPLLADGGRLAQVLTNLIGNAIKFTPEGGSITVTARLADGRLRCTIEDTGVGIAAADLPKLFKQFGLLDMSATRATSGTGLGLSISKGLIEAHGGQIGVVSTVGAGSCFWFTLPLRPVTDDAR